MKVVYFKTEGLTEEQLRELFDIMEETGAEVYHIPKDNRGHLYYGIDDDGDIIFCNRSSLYEGGIEVEPTPEALRKALDITDDTKHLRDVKLRVLSKEHSKAFQEAVFESGGEWWTSGLTVPTLLSKSYLFVDEEGFIVYGDDESRFNQHAYKEITFTPTTTWKVSYVENKIHIKEGDYTKEELLALIEEEK